MAPLFYLPLKRTYVSYWQEVGKHTHYNGAKIVE